MFQAMFIFWSDGLHLVEDCRRHLQENCVIQADIEFEWSEEMISENMKRLYQQPLQKDMDTLFGREKMAGKNLHVFYVSTHMGGNVFHRSAAGEIEFVNSHIIGLKAKFRKLVEASTGTPYLVHCASSREELKLQSALIFGLTELRRLEAGELLVGNYRRRDLYGSGGWESLSDAFEFMSYLVNWSVMRGWASLPGSVSGDDLDILVDNRKIVFAALGLKQSSDHDFLRNGYMDIKNIKKPIKFDVHWVGDGYFDTKWQYSFLANKRRVSTFFIPDKVNGLMMYLYAEYVARPNPRPEKFERLASLIEELDKNSVIGKDILLDENRVLRLLNDFMSQNSYQLSVPLVKRHQISKKAEKLLKSPSKRPFRDRSVLVRNVIFAMKLLLPMSFQNKIRELKLKK
jgi:hypothetical protein